MLCGRLLRQSERRGAANFMRKLVQELHGGSAWRGGLTEGIEALLLLPVPALMCIPVPREQTAGLG